MDKLHNKNWKGNSKKDIFYLVLFICLCVVATTAGVMSIKKNNVKPNVVKTPVAQSKSVAKNVKKAEEEKNTKIENANLVKKQQNAKEKSKNASSVATNADQKKVSFSKPIDGKVITNYTGSNGVAKTEEGGRSILGIYISENNPNSKVSAAADGVVVFSGINDEYGEKVVLDHGNGYRTIYSNLSEKNLPKVNTQVKKGDTIGFTGSTAKNIYEVPNLINNKTALYFQIVKLSKESDGKKCYIDVNPNDYVKYEVNKQTK